MYEPPQAGQVEASAEGTLQAARQQQPNFLEVQAHQRAYQGLMVETDLGGPAKDNALQALTIVAQVCLTLTAEASLTLIADV